MKYKNRKEDDEYEQQREILCNCREKPVDRPACWLGDPTPEAVPALCEYYHVDNIKELKKVCGDDSMQ